MRYGMSPITVLRPAKSATRPFPTVIGVALYSPRESIVFYMSVSTVILSKADSRGFGSVFYKL